MKIVEMARSICLVGQFSLVASSIVLWLGFLYSGGHASCSAYSETHAEDGL